VAKKLNIFQLKQIKRGRADPEDLDLCLCSKINELSQKKRKKVLLNNEYLVTWIFQHWSSMLTQEKKASVNTFIESLKK